MSLHALKQCWLPEFPADCDGVSPALVTAVALAIADVVNDKSQNEFYGSITNLAVKARVNRKLCGAIVAHLVSAGVIEVLQERRGRTTRYRWLGVGSEAAGEAATPAVRDRDPRGQGPRDPNESQSDPQVGEHTFTSGNAETASTGEGLISESIACPTGQRSGGCGAARGKPCVDHGKAKRYRGRSHTIRVAHVLTAVWWEGVKERTGHRPAGVEFLAMRNIMRKMLDADWKHTAVAAAVEQLHQEGRPISGQSVEARLRGKFPGQRLSVVSQARLSIERGARGEAPSLPEFGSRSTFNLTTPNQGAPHAIGS